MVVRLESPDPHQLHWRMAHIEAIAQYMTPNWQRLCFERWLVITGRRDLVGDSNGG